MIRPADAVNGRHEPRGETQMRNVAVMTTMVAALAGAGWAQQAATSGVQQADWPCYLGPNGNHGAGPFAGAMVERFAAARLAWVSDVPIPDGMAGDGRGPLAGRFGVSGGYASPVVAGGRVYVQYYVPAGEVAGESHVTKFGEPMRPKFLVEADDVIHCFDAATGKTAWRAVLPRTAMNFQGFTKGGPSLTCCVAGGRVYLHSSGGRVICLRADTGAKLWEAKTARHAYQEKLRAWAKARRAIPAYNRDFKTSPAVIGGVVVFNDHRYHKTMADKGWEMFYDAPSNLVALDGETGKELWRVAGGLSNGANPVRWVCEGKEYLIAKGWPDVGVQCIEPRSGKVLWRITGGPDGKYLFSGSRTPCVAGPYLVTAAGPPRGQHHVCYRIDLKGATKLWQLPSQYGCPGLSMPAAQNGYLYTETSPRGQLLCVELATGKVVGTAPANRESHFGYFPRVMGSRLVCGGGDTDQLHLYDADPANFRLLDDAKIANAWGYETPILPALAAGRLFLRTHDRLVCIDLRAEAAGGKLLGETDVLRPAEAGKRPPKPPAAKPAPAGAKTPSGLGDGDDIDIDLKLD